jgi:hypothetical protein
MSENEMFVSTGVAALYLECDEAKIRRFSELGSLRPVETADRQLMIETGSLKKMRAEQEAARNTSATANAECAERIAELRREGVEKMALAVSDELCEPFEFAVLGAMQRGVSEHTATAEAFLDVHAMPAPEQSDRRRCNRVGEP